MSYIVGTPGNAPRLIMDVAEEHARAQLGDGEVFFEADVPPGRWVIGAGEEGLVAYVPPLDLLKDARWLEARNYRDLRASGGCATPSGRIDTDPESRSKINGACTAAMVSKTAGEPFVVDWTMEDNSIVRMDADAVIAAGLAVMQHVDLCQAVGTAIRQRINSAASTAELDEIDIRAGYP